VNTARKGRGGAVTSVPFSARIRAVWDPSQRATAKALVAAVLAFLCSLVVSCSGETAGEDRATTGQPEDREESIPLASPDDGPETAGVLIAGDTTRSVQQTNTRGSVINVSYTGG
jgi:hypothetical protein